jgi:hypothetical protein
MLGFLHYTTSAKLNKHVVSFWQVTTVVLTLAFYALGARQNALDVLLIESEMVRTARWVEQNLPPDARLAVHDIGALGFYVSNPLLDLAGLTSPEVIPFIRDEARLADYLDENSVDYLITFPSFYPQLTEGQEVVFEAGLERGPQQFDEHIRVYLWR